MHCANVSRREEASIPDYVPGPLQLSGTRSAEKDHAVPVVLLLQRYFLMECEFDARIDVAHNFVWKRRKREGRLRVKVVF